MICIHIRYQHHMQIVASTLLPQRYSRDTATRIRGGGCYCVPCELCGVIQHRIHIRPHLPPHTNRDGGVRGSSLGLRPIYTHTHTFEHPDHSSLSICTFIKYKEPAFLCVCVVVTRIRFARVANLSVLWLSSRHATAGLMEQMIATRPLPWITII